MYNKQDLQHFPIIRCYSEIQALFPYPHQLLVVENEQSKLDRLPQRGTLGLARVVESGVRSQNGGLAIILRVEATNHNQHKPIMR